MRSALPALRALRRTQPAFLWAAADAYGFQPRFDVVGGVVGSPQGLYITTVGGPPMWRGFDGGNSGLRFDTGLGLTATTPWIALIIASCASTSQSGALLKIGLGQSRTGIADGQGWGFGVGGSTFDDAGNQLIGLRESLVWAAGTTSKLTLGCNLLVASYTSDNLFAFGNLGTGLSDSVAGVSANAAPTAIFVNGYSAGDGSDARSIAAQVHAVAIWVESVAFASMMSVMLERVRPLMWMHGLPAEAGTLAMRDPIEQDYRSPAIDYVRPQIHIPRTAVHRASRW